MKDCILSPSVGQRREVVLMFVYVNVRASKDNTLFPVPLHTIPMHFTEPRKPK